MTFDNIMRANYLLFVYSPTERQAGRKEGGFGKPPILNVISTNFDMFTNSNIKFSRARTK